MLLREKTIYITGGSKGIGLAIAKLFKKKGARIVLFARNIKTLKIAKKEIDEENYQQNDKLSNNLSTSFYCLDVSHSEEIKQIMFQAVKETAPPDILINCAGRSIPQYFEKISNLQMEETFKVNFFSIWYCCQTLLPYLKKTQGYIINVSSLAGALPIFGYSDYAASKSAIIAFSEVLRSEVKKEGVQVSVLLPIDTDSPGYQEENKTKPLETKAISKYSSLMEPEEVASQLYRGMKSNQFIIIPSLPDRFFYFLKKIFPNLITFFIEKIISKAQKNYKIF